MPVMMVDRKGTGRGARGLRGGVGLALGVGGLTQSYSDASAFGLGTLTSAAGGAMIGSMIAPGIGTAIGAAIGGLAGVIWFMGGAARDRQRQQNVLRTASELQSLNVSGMTSSELFSLRDSLSGSASLITGLSGLDRNFGFLVLDLGARVAPYLILLVQHC